ncbi:hypothetical protein B0H14DRAFT_2562942 [Mycena olivaceomarginata]|nr:hypothetical protein B0H14DRAFT_2562942 [Mycena olivaceomarginata]
MLHTRPVDLHAKKKKQNLAKSKLGIAKSGRIAAPPAIGSTQHLEVLLNPNRLLTEIAEVQESHPTKSAASRLFFQALGAQSLGLDVVDTCFIKAKRLVTLDMVIENSRRTPLEVASAQFAKLATSARAISSPLLDQWLPY